MSAERFQPDAEPPPPPAPALPWWGVAAGLVLCLSFLGLLIAKPPQRPAQNGTYDASSVGTRAAYLLLDEMGIPVRQSKRVAEGRLRWLLFPRGESKEIDTVKEWLASGRTLLLADPSGRFTKSLGLALDSDPSADATVSVFINSKRYRVQTGGKSVDATTRPDLVWPEDTEHPLASIYRHLGGELWLVHYPNLFKNHLLFEGLKGTNDNAQVLYHLAVAMRESSNETIYVDEYFHGMRERPSVTELLLEPPILWTTLHGLGLLAFALWAFSPRFGQLQTLERPRRRSKEEYLHAIAGILEQKRAYERAYDTVQQAFLRDLARDLGLPLTAPPKAIFDQATLRRKRIDPERLRAALSQKPPLDNESEFLASLHELEDLRHVCFAR
jgi:hypothetical protein